MAREDYQPVSATPDPASAAPAIPKTRRRGGLVHALPSVRPPLGLLPLSRFSRSELRRQVLEARIVADISGVTILRWLHEDALRYCLDTTLTCHQFLSLFPVYNHELFCVCNIVRETNGMISKS